MSSRHSPRRERKASSTSVLVPLDGNEASASVLVYGIELARKIGSRLVLLAVPHEAGPLADEPGARKYLDAIAEGLRLRGIAHDVQLASGDVAEQVAVAATRERCELILMTPHARPDGAPTLLGGTADRVVRSSAVPVMLIRPEQVESTLTHWTSPPSFVVGLDGSALAATAVEFAAGLASRLGSELILVRAIEPALPLGGAASYYQSPLDIALNYLREVADVTAREGLKVRCEVLPGPAAAEIIKAANAQERAVIALCTRGYSGRKDWVLGSVTDSVVRSTRHPVLVIPPGATR